MRKVIVITGGSSGIGKAASAALAGQGCTVYELSRRTPDPSPATHLTADVSSSTSVDAAIREVYRREGRIDVLICNAGVGVSGAVEFLTPEDTARMFDVNLFGVFNAVRSALPFLRESRGRVICTSSVAAVVPIPFQTYYSVSKAAVNAFCLALKNEVRPFGVSVTAVMLGDIRSGFTDARSRRHEGDDVYLGRIERSVAVMERDERGGMPPVAAGALLCTLSLKKRVRPFYTLGLQYRLFTFLARILPYRLICFVLYQLYAK